MIILIAVLIGIPVGVLMEALFLNLTTKIFKVEGATYKKALKISVIFLLASIVVGLIIGILFSMIMNIAIVGNILAVVAGFFIANFLYKKYYLTDTKKNVKIYIVKMILSGVATFVIALAIILPIRMFIFQPFYMQGASMEPNLTDGQYMLFKEYDKNYQRGEVIVFKYPKNEKQFFLKRIIGLPGEKIEIKDGIVYINGKVLDESSYLSKDVQTKGLVGVTLGNDEYFVMGDNRMFSSDSRSWGPVKKSLMVGKYWTTLSMPK